MWKEQGEENEYLEVYNVEKKTLDFRKQRATKLRENPRVHLPTPRPHQEEVMMGAKEIFWEEEAARYREENCDTKGNIIEENLTQLQKQGLVSMEEKKKKGRLVVSQTDKSGKLTASSMENYVEQEQKHVKGDRPIGGKEVKEIQKTLQHHTRAVCNIFQQGREFGEQRYLRGSKRVLWRHVSSRRFCLIAM